METNKEQLTLQQITALDRAELVQSLKQIRAHYPHYLNDVLHSTEEYLEQVRFWLEHINFDAISAMNFAAFHDDPIGLKMLTQWSILRGFFGSQRIQQFWLLMDESYYIDLAKECEIPTVGPEATPWEDFTVMRQSLQPDFIRNLILGYYRETQKKTIRRGMDENETSELVRTVLYPRLNIIKGQVPSLFHELPELMESIPELVDDWVRYHNCELNIGEPQRMDNLDRWYWRDDAAMLDILNKVDLARSYFGIGEVRDVWADFINTGHYDLLEDLCKEVNVPFYNEFSDVINEVSIFKRLERRKTGLSFEYLEEVFTNLMDESYLYKLVGTCIQDINDEMDMEGLDFDDLDERAIFLSI